MPSRQIDSTRIWSRTAEIDDENITKIVIMLTRQQPDAPIELRKLTGREVLGLQLMLGLTAEELVTKADAMLVESMPRELKDGRALHLALAHFGPLTDEEVTSVFGWSMQKLEAAVEVLEGLLIETGRQVQRNGCLLSLQEEKYALSSTVTDALRARRDWSLPVLAQEACLLVAALRRLPPRAQSAVELPAATVAELVQRGIAAPPHSATAETDDLDDARTAREESLPFVLHPDVVFAFSVGEPSMASGVVNACADHRSDPL